MNKPNEAVEILKTEYGITTMKELDAAIRKIGFLDISPFCSENENRRYDKEEMLCKEYKNAAN